MGAGTAYANGATYTANASVTLYAQWTANTYTVSFDANTGTGTMAAQTKTHGVNLTLSPNTFTKTGNSFAGWNTAANGSGTAYANGAIYTANASVTLYAQWTVNTYTVSFDANTGTGTMAAQTKTHGVNLTLSSNTFTKTGHSFAGWNTLANGSGTAYANGATYTANASVTLYAQWTANTYTVTYDGNGNTGGTTPANQTKTHGVSLTLATNSGALVKTGSTFLGWNTATDGTGTNYAGGAPYTADAAVTLYANWTTATTYTVTYNGNGETGGSVPVDGNNYTNGMTVTVLGNTGNLVRTGYTFTGWNTTAGGTGTSYAPAATFAIAANTTLYAQWTLNTYTVTYNGNGHTGGAAPASQTKTHGVNLTLATNSGALVKTGSTFVGWNTAANGSGTD